MDSHTSAAEVQFDFKQAIELQFKRIAQSYAELNNTNVNAVVRFSPDLRIVAVDVETFSTTPFFMNINILRILEGAVDFIENNQYLTTTGFELVERATVDVNNLNALGRVHKKNTRLPYHTSQAFIFRTTTQTINLLLSSIHQQLEFKKTAPDYIEKVKVTHSNLSTGRLIEVQDMNFTNTNISTQYKLHDSVVFSQDINHLNEVAVTTTKTAITHLNQVVMGVTIELRNKKNGRIATLHIPNRFMSEFVSQPSARISGGDLQDIPFVYYDWLVGEDEIINLLQSGAYNHYSLHLNNHIKPFIRYDVELISVQPHIFEYKIPTSNYAPISEVSFIAVLHNQNSLFESIMIKIDRSNNINVFNSRGLVICLSEKHIPSLSVLKENAQELFKNNRQYTFDQIKQLRKKMGGFNGGLAVKNEHIYLP